MQWTLFTTICHQSGLKLQEYAFILNLDLPVYELNRFYFNDILRWFVEKLPI